MELVHLSFSLGVSHDASSLSDNTLTTETVICYTRTSLTLIVN